jgi:DNA-binding beta-propeller fold protein YncE
VASVPRWVLVVLGAAVCVAAADVAVIVGADRGSGGVEQAGDVVAVIDPAKNRVTTLVHVGGQPTAVVAGFGGVWVLNKGPGTLTHIDAHSRRVVSTLEPDATASDLTLGAGGIWFVGRARTNIGAPVEAARLERIQPSTGAVDRTFDTRTGAFVVAAGAGAVWSTGNLGGHIRGAARSDARTGAMRKLEIGIYGDLVTADDNAVYYVGSIGNRVARVSASTGRLTNSLKLVSNASLAAGHVPATPTDVVVGGGALWISESDGTVLHLDPRLRGITAAIPACRNAVALAYGEHAVWVACGENTVVRIDPATGARGAPIAVGRLPRGIAAGEGGVWVTLN